MSGYPDTPFTIVSADNLDYVHSHARVYCGKQQSSWHGTTVQVVQPRPTTSLHTSHGIQTLNEREAVTNGEATTSLNTVHCVYRHPEYPATGTLEARLQGHVVKRSYSNSSPSNSPGKQRSPLPKRYRRMRTGTEGARRNINDEPDSASPANHMEF